MSSFPDSPTRRDHDILNRGFLEGPSPVPKERGCDGGLPGWRSSARVGLQPEQAQPQEGRVSPKGGDSTAPVQPSVRLLGSCPPRAGLRKVQSWGTCAVNFQVRPV